MLQTRQRQERVPPSVQRILILLAALCGGTVSLFTDRWLSLASVLAVLTVGLTTTITDWLCRIIPNPTVLAIFALKFLLISADLLNIPGAVPFSPLSSLGGTVFCFLLFSAPGLLGKQVGAGDIKLVAAMGFLLEFNGSLLAIGIMGLLILGYCILQQKLPLHLFLKTNIPMGPFISAGMMLVFTAGCMTG